MINLFSNLSIGAYKGFGLLTAVSGMVVIVVGVLLAVEAPSLLVEYTYTTDDYWGYSMTYITRFPILPIIMMTLGASTFAMALRGYRHLSLLTSLCSGLVVTWLTSMLPRSPGFRITKFGYPLGWLARMTPPMSIPPYIMGIIALPFLIDLALWSLVAWAIIFSVNRIKARTNYGRARGEILGQRVHL